MSYSRVRSEIFENMQENSFLMLEDSQDEFVISSPRAKKRRLDHLSWEEKLQRKKLKNRVAAQTSRDRKKARMEQMENTLSNLLSQNEKIAAECESLKKLNRKLTEENASLNRKLNEPCHTCAQSRSVECDVQPGSTASDLPQQGLDRHSAAALTPPSRTALWRIVLACLLSQTSSTKSTTTSTSPLGNSSHRPFCRISPGTWKLLLKNPTITKDQRDMGKVILRKWWGRHQKTWNPVALE